MYIIAQTLESCNNKSCKISVDFYFQKCSERCGLQKKKQKSNIYHIFNTKKQQKKSVLGFGFYPPLPTSKRDENIVQNPSIVYIILYRVLKLHSKNTLIFYFKLYKELFAISSDKIGRSGN